MLEVKDLQTGKEKPKSNWQPSERQRKVLFEVHEEMNIAINFRSAYEEQWKENVERYKAEPFYHEDGRAGVVLPIAKWIIESKQATEMKAPPSFSYAPLEYEEDKQVAMILDEIVKKHVWSLKYVNLNYKFDVLNQDKDILGTMYQYVGWKKIYCTIRDQKGGEEKDGQKPIPSEGHGEENESPKEDKQENTNEKGENKKEEDPFTSKQELYYDDICVENIYPQDFWLHPLAMGVFDSPWAHWRKRFDYGTFLEQFSDTKMYKNIDFVQPGKWSMYRQDNTVLTKEYQGEDKNEVVVFEHWNKMKDQLVIEANGVIIYEGPNPYAHKELPFTDYIDRLQFNTHIGEGEPQRVASICDAINAFINIAVDKEKRAGSGLNLIDEDLSDFDDVASMISSNSALRVTDPKNAFVHYELPGMSSSTQQIISMLMDYLVFATGVDFKQITDLNTSTQATVAAIRREITQIRLNLGVRRNENRGIKRLGWLLMKLVQQYYPLPKVEYLSGQADDKNIYRKIRIKGQKIVEEPKGDQYTAESLKLKSVGENEYGFFQARPAYIRTKGDLEVRVIAESTFAASRELEKASAKEYVEVAQTAVETDEQGQPKPILSLKYGLRKYVNSLGYDEEKAFDTSNSDMKNPAREEAEKLLGGNLDALKGQMNKGGQPIANAGQMPPEPTPTKLVGQNSEPVQQLKAQLGAANNIANK